MSSDETPESKGYTVKRRGAIGNARADFACASKTCATKKGARVYELPAATTRCPVCGSKRLQRLMSAPHISRGIAKRADAALGPEYTRQKQKREAAKETQRNSPMLAVDTRHGLAAGIQEGMARAGYGHIPVPVPLAEKGKATPTPRLTSPDLAGIVAAGGGRGPRPELAKAPYKPTPAEVAAARRNA